MCAGLEEGNAETSLVTLEQSLEPNFKPPKPFDGLIKGKFSADSAILLERPAVECAESLASAFQEQKGLDSLYTICNRLYA